MQRSGSGRRALRAIEAELAGHATFGDARRILDRLRAVTLMRLEAASPNRPPVQALCKELRDGRRRAAAADLLADPVVLTGIHDLLEATRRGDASRAAEIEELCAAALRRVRDGASGLPTAAGCRLHVHPAGTSPAIALWDPDAPASIFKRRFESAFDASFDGLGVGSLRRPEPALADAVGRGRELLALVLPDLAASALAHLRLIGCIGGKKVNSISEISIASTTFVSSDLVQTPWETAEMLLHEALHSKLGDLVDSRPIFRWDGGAPTIQVIWRRNRSVDAADWSLNRAFSAFHVYVHLALFFARVERLETPSAGAFGPMPASFRRGFRTAIERAGHLRRALDAAGPPLGSAGRSMFAWLSQTLQRLPAAA